MPVRYPVACHPQAWAAGALPFLTTTLLGLVPEALDRRLRVGGARVDLRFQRTDGDTVEVQIFRTEGPWEVVTQFEEKS